MVIVSLVECVPNFSEGRRPEVIQALRDAAAGVPGAFVLDVHSDAVHNRSVITLAGLDEAVLEAAFRCIHRATELIDMRKHRGEHPRIGATDVVPFVPLGATTMADCVSLAHELGQRVGETLGIPVYLYAQAAKRPERQWLPTVREGEYEGLVTAISREPDRAPDFGPSALGTAGATAIGARPFLLAYNINLATSRLDQARDIARAIRQSSGGFAAVQARAMITDSPEVTQVSMNLLDPGVTPTHLVFGTVQQLARARGIAVVGAELVGLMPLVVSTAAAGAAVGLPDLRPSQVIEDRVLSAILSQLDQESR
jgi:glutamate formiminotransferase